MTAPAAARLPARPARAVVLFAALTCAACGLVYELALIALGSYLIGNSVEQASVVLSVFVFSMGLGALAAKRLRHQPVVAFAAVEGSLALVGGLSVLALYAAFAWLDLYRPALVVTSLVVGALIGAEIPLLMTLVQRIRAQDAGEAVADLFAADYVGALVGGLAFPFLLLPAFGQVKGALLTGAVNVVAAALVVGWLFGHSLAPRVRLAVGAGLTSVLLVLGAAATTADRFEISARQALYEDPIVHSERTPYQDVVLTESLSLRGPRDVRLFLNGDLQFSSVDEYRYHEALVHPALAGRRERVLVLGGGDGLALREVLRHPDVRSVVEVELDPAVLRLARRDPRLVELNGGALHDPRVTVVAADAFSWLRTQGERFDVIIADFPEPDEVPIAKLYSQEFYTLASAALAPGGRLVVQAGSPAFARHAFWCIEATMRAAGLHTLPYHVDVPSFGDWGFVLAAAEPPELRLPSPLPPGVRSLDAGSMDAASVFAPDRARVPVEPSTLLHPRIVEYERRGWQQY